METMFSEFFMFLLIGLLAGWIASKLVSGRGLGIMGSLIIGVIGAAVGGFLFRQFSIETAGMLGDLIAAVVGAIVLLWVINLGKGRM
jgi:uncharacterized membrane protein YeaQ/YmgE (transglycosylase-associated protein family)